MRVRHLLCFFFFVPTAFAQPSRQPFAAWVFPGISWQASPSFQLTTHYGYNPRLRLHAGYLQGFYRIGSHWSLNPAYLALAGATGLEHTLLHGAVFSLPVGKRWLLEDRQQLWNRLRAGEEGLHFYRNRLRLFALAGARRHIRPYFSGEAFYFFNRGRWSRYRAGAGLAWAAPEKIGVDAAVVREVDAFGGRRWLAFVLVTLPVARGAASGIERKNQHH